MHRLRLSFAFLFSFCVLSPPLRADPRWWWEERKIADAFEISSLDIAVAPKLTDDAYPPPVFVAWIVPGAMIEGHLALTATFDGGCTFCNPVHLDTVFGRFTETSLAVGILPSGYYAIQAAHNDGGSLHVIIDSATVPMSAHGSDGCKALELIGGALRRVTLNDPGSSSVGPFDLTGDTFLGGVTQFHCVWQDSRDPAGVEVYYSRDLIGDGTWAAERVLTTGRPPTGDALVPSVSMDFTTDAPAPGLASVNVAFVDASDAMVYYLRSTDSGATFSASGAPPGGPPAAVTDTPWAEGRGRPILDSGCLGDATTSPLWHGVLWPQSGFLPEPTFLLDAQLNDTAAHAQVPWGVDVEIRPTAPFSGSGRSSALSVLPTLSGRSAAFAFWMETSTGAGEAWSRAGVLDGSGVGKPVDFDTYPFPAARPLDPTASPPLQISACRYSEATGGCDPARTDGAVSVLAADETPADVFLVFHDTRSDGTGIYFKRTDRSVAPPAVTLSARCDSGSVTVTVSWSPFACGGTAPERVIRYRVDHGLQSGGPYPSEAVIDDNGSLPDPVTLDVPGLLPSTQYFFIVTPEDEARNLSPPDFDPLKANGPLPLQNEAAVTTPACRCLCRSQASSLAPLDPPRAEIFTLPDPQGISLDPAARLAEVPYRCPFDPGMTDPDPVLLPGSNPLVYYQVTGRGALAVRVVKEPSQDTVRFDF